MHFFRGPDISVLLHRIFCIKHLLLPNRGSCKELKFDMKCIVSIPYYSPFPRSVSFDMTWVLQYPVERQSKKVENDTPCNQKNAKEAHDSAVTFVFFSNANGDVG